MGPAQSGKSEVGNNWQLHSVVCDPADMITVGPDKDVMRSYVVSQINKMIRLSPELKRRQLQTPSADNIFSKEFQGCTWFFAWPVPAQIRMRPVPRFRVEDYDVIPTDIGGEGNVIMLLTGRQTTFEGYELGYVNSSPALGVERGIEALVATGTDERWFVDCLHCAAPFDLAFGNCLHFERGGTADDARESAAVACPECGGLIEHADKSALMATGRWVGEGQTAVTGGVEGDLRDVRVASFRIDGLMGFASWGRIAELYRAAELTFEATQDEFDLRAVVNSRIGVNYRSRLAGAEPVSADELTARAAASDYRMGEVPPGVVCLTAAVDVQGNRFEVMVMGWGVGFESWVIDRYPILALDDGTSAIDPGGRPEQWGVLLNKVIWRKYRLRGSDSADVPIMTTAIDTGGMDGVTNNAFAFWYTALRAGVQRKSITLIKGGNNPRARLLPPPTIDTRRKSGRRDPDSELFVPNVHRFKDMIDVRMRRSGDGPTFIHWPADIGPEYLKEATAETKESGAWTRIKGRANETLDLLVYNAVALTRLGAADSSMRWVPHWAMPPGVVVSGDAPVRTSAPPAAPSTSFKRRGL
jgi:phage terminase large subunit GpA-like protein